MSESKRILGVITDKATGEQLEMESAYVGNYRGGRIVSVVKTEIGSYALCVKTPDENGDIRVQKMHLSKVDFSALLNAMAGFLEEEGTTASEFSDLSIDENSGYLYRTLDDYKEEETE